MKRFNFFILTVLTMFTLLGCGVAGQIGAGMIGNAIGNGMEKTLTTPKPSANLTPIKFDKKLEKHKIGEYEVVFGEGRINGQPHYLFLLFTSNGLDKTVYYEKNDKNDMREIEAYLKMNDTDKRNFIKKSFIKYAKIDLEPEEPKKPSETAEKPPNTYQNFPMPSFAPKSY